MIVTAIRHLVAIAILPFTVAALVPLWIGQRNQTAIAAGGDAVSILLQLAGVVAVGVGLVLFAASLTRFAREGKGTLAPWDPPRQLVVVGPYRYVRNPMISGVVFVLFGEAAVLLSMPHLWWAVTFVGINLAYITAFEEPQLEARFGESYREYKRHVPRLVPRVEAWPGERRTKDEDRRTER